MKKLLSLFFIAIVFWTVLVLIDYTRAYVNNEKMLITINIDVQDEYTKREGLGYSIIKYDYDKNNVKEGQPVKEFRIFGYVISKEIITFKENSTF